MRYKTKQLFLVQTIVVNNCNIPENNCHMKLLCKLSQELCRETKELCRETKELCRETRELCRDVSRQFVDQMVRQMLRQLFNIDWLQHNYFDKISTCSGQMLRNNLTATLWLTACGPWPVAFVRNPASQSVPLSPAMGPARRVVYRP